METSLVSKNQTGKPQEASPSLNTESPIRPVTILTGYLGAGKTTFLNALLKANENIRYAIIENEIGKEGIDGELLVRADGGFIELDNGCLCCTLNEDLYQAISQLHEQADRFDELIIECTGLAEPSGVAEPFLIHPVIKSAFPLKQVICLVDAELIEDQLRERGEAIMQIAFSDVVLLNKSDLVSPGYVSELKERLAKLSPFSEIFIGSKDAYPLPALLRVTHKITPKVFNLAAPPESSRADHWSPLQPKKQFRHGDIVSLSFYIREELDLRQLFFNLYQFLAIHGGRIYRMKGIFYETGNPVKVIIQSVGGRLGIEEGKDWMDGEERGNRIVFIGKNIQDLDIERLLKGNQAH